MHKGMEVMLKRYISAILCVCLLLSLAACGGNSMPAETSKANYLAAQSDIALLDKAYEDRVAYHGEMHDHANTGGTSDGQKDLAFWKLALDGFDMDFATIVDHQQALHMQLEDWDNTIFVGGSEAAAFPSDLQAATVRQMHFNMIFSKPEDLINTVTAYDALYPDTGFKSQVFPEDYDGEYADQMAGDWHFTYLYGDTAPTKAQMAQLIEIIKENNGMFVHVHPKSDGCIDSTDPLDYWFADYTGLEVFYGYRGYAPERPEVQRNYQLWKDLLALGKKVYATAGSDKHALPNTDALTTVYAAQKHADAFLDRFQAGDFVCGPVGIRMVIGDATMGGETEFAGQRVVFSVGDFHSSAYNRTQKYRVDLYDDQDLVFSQVLEDPAQTTCFAVDARADAAFYRVEIHNETTGLLHALGNPIWNVK